MLSNNLVSVFQSFILQRAPAFGSVVLIHTEPVGRGLVSVSLKAGTCVCFAMCNDGGKKSSSAWLSVKIPIATSAVPPPLPLASDTMPDCVESGPDTVPSL